MTEFLTAAYPWTKTLHIVSMVAWMAGLFYLPRVFVYHSERAGVPGETSEIFKTMEVKLLRLIMTPSMIATWVFGLVLVATPGVLDWSRDLWIYPKLAAVLALTWFHHWLGLRRKEFARDANTRSGRAYRLMNELPTLLLVTIVALVVVKPF
ncbi:MAG: protoporphyrinogen oxidase HemJ [Rhodobacteraceae bacterium]|nr:protoporphyrinogen oxidase HemJ [Paracoccaceae bacterium]